MALVNEMSRDAFGTQIADKIAEIRNKALNNKVTKETIEDIITSVYQQSQGLSEATAVRKINGAISTAIRAASATTLVGVLVGSRDLVGKRSPIRYTLIKKDKQHLEISNFGTTAPYNGEDIEIPVPSMVTIKAEYDSEYDSWNLISIESHQSLNKTQLQKVLSQVQIPISAINKDMAYSKGKAAKPVVINGTLAFLGAEVVFKTRSEEEREEGKKAEIDHALPMSMPRELSKDLKDALPCFQFSLRGKGHGGNSVRCHLSAQRYGTPTAFITDLGSLCNRAVQKYSTNPEEQAKNLFEWLKDMNVVVVGTVSSFKKTYGEDKSERNYVDIGVSCVLEVEGNLDGTPVQKHLSEEPPKGAPHITTETPPIQTPPAAKKTAPKTPPPAEPEEDLFGIGETNVEPPEEPPVAAAPPAAKKAAPVKKTAPPPAAPAAAPATGQKVVKISDLAKMIKTFLRASGLKIGDLTMDQLRSQALDIIEPDGVPIPEAVIQEAIDLIKAME